MNETDLLDLARQKLTDAISQYQPPIHSPLQVSTWIAMSLLQKAIRRGEDGLTHKHVGTGPLFRFNPETPTPFNSNVRSSLKRS